ncbi:MAG: Uncharacterised protein [Bacteroidota bacterium]|nr:MAG: Uncharacterised protein [Bacteroidota bacterium]
MKRLTYLFALALCSLTGCEPDDICLAETPGTPQLVVVFYDALQPEIKKEASNLQVKGFGFETEIHKGTTDSIVIPLRTIENETAFVFTKTENDIAFEEEITFKYETYDRFISRACGYQKNFTNIRSERLNSIVWINYIEIIKDSISDTNNTHVKILH